jgi:hypothetical protein
MKSSLLSKPKVLKETKMKNKTKWTRFLGPFVFKSSNFQKPKSGFPLTSTIVMLNKNCLNVAPFFFYGKMFSVFSPFMRTCMETTQTNVMHT